ncbi:MAG TPA: FAD-binding protein [Thermodesulfobacteriota bacterium]|nr:FAD-binding protein [Thermodesulfobacteriota bacterium]
MSEQNVEAIASDLRKRLEGNVLSDDLSRTIYSSGACIYSLRPMLIVQPKHRQDVVECVRYSMAHGIPLTARGGGTAEQGRGLEKG